MVFTCAVHPDSRPRLTRRATLAALSGGVITVALAGCTSHPAQALPVAQTVAADPIGPIYTEALALVSAYDQAIAVNSPLVGLLGPLREEHHRHATALAALMGIASPSVSPGPDPSGTPMPALPSPPPSSGPSASASVPPTPGPVAIPSLGQDTAVSRADLSESEKTAQTNAIQACMVATGDRAAVLASIAASCATHVAVLR
jgi:hypothetical protein